MSWGILMGVVEWWADEERRDVGRRRFSEVRGAAPPSDVAAPGSIDRVRAAFVAQREPWRLSEVALETTNGDVTPAVAAWADGATAVLKGHPAQQHVVGPNESWGDLGVRRLLEPAALHALVPKPWAAAFRVPGEVLERDLSALAELVSLGADRYEVDYDGELDVITAWTAIVDGAAAQRIVLSDLSSPAIERMSTNSLGMR